MAYRLFIAVPLPAAIKDAIERTQRELRQALPSAGLRWTRRDQFHLTLRFLGSVDEQRLDRLTDAVGNVCSRSGPLELRASGLGIFPDARRPRVVWAGVEDERGRLGILQRAIESATDAFTSEPPQKTFTGHVTLARCRELDGRDARKLSTLVENGSSRSFGEWTAEHVEIVRSETASTGSRYTTLFAARCSPIE